MGKTGKTFSEEITNKAIVTMTPELTKKLDDLAKTKYRGVKRVQAIRWMIEDAWVEYQKERPTEELRLE